jgi:hypothetical protein
MMDPIEDDPAQSRLSSATPKIIAPTTAKMIQFVISGCTLPFFSNMVVVNNPRIVPNIDPICITYSDS